MAVIVLRTKECKRFEWEVRRKEEAVLYRVMTWEILSARHTRSAQPNFA